MSYLKLGRLPSYHEVRTLLDNSGNLFTQTAFGDEERKDQIFQFWNIEYIETLAKEISKRVGKKLVLEVCAGDGLLSQYLKDRGVNIIATDNFSWQKRLRISKHVEKCSALKAVNKYRPEMVIASWIPYGKELDYNLLKMHIPYVIIIGEGHGGCCGSEKIWKPFLRRRHGYMLMILDDVDQWNICRTDWSVNYCRHSVTALFERRMENGSKVSGD